MTQVATLKLHAESLTERAQTTVPALLFTVGLCLGLAGSAIIDRKVCALAGSVLLFALAAAASRNARLFTLWLFFLALPFNLSKYFGSIDLVGGEIAYRIEISDFFLAILLLYQVREVFLGRRRGLKVPKVLLWWILIFTMGCVAIFVQPYQDLVGHELVRMVKMAVLFIVIASELHTVKRFVHMSSALLLGATIQSIIALAQYIHGSPLGYPVLGETNPRTTQILAMSSVQGEHVYRVSAFMLHPNIFGAFLGSTLALALGLMLIKTIPFARLYFLAVLAFGIPALVATQSRAGWLSFAASCSTVLLLSFFHRRVKMHSFVAVPLIVLVSVIVLSAFSDRIMTRLFHSKEDASLGRDAFKEDAKRMIAEKPLLGFGLNTYSLAVEPYMKFTVKSFEGGVLPPVHNIYLLWFAETGVLGFTFHIAMWGSLLWEAFRNLKVRNDVLYMVNAGCIAGYVALLLDGNFSFTWRMNSIQKVFWVFSGMVMAISYWRKEHETHARSIRMFDTPQVAMLESEL